MSTSNDLNESCTTHALIIQEWSPYLLLILASWNFRNLRRTNTGGDLISRRKAKAGRTQRLPVSCRRSAKAWLHLEHPRQRRRARRTERAVSRRQAPVPDLSHCSAAPDCRAHPPQLERCLKINNYDSNSAVAASARQRLLDGDVNDDKRHYQ